MRYLLVGFALSLVFSGCGGGKTTAPTPVRTLTVYTGDNQTARIGSVVSTPPAVIVREGGQPVPGVAVTFTVASGGGAVTGATITTNGSGVAAVGSWKLGGTAGANTLTASATGVTGSPVQFTATARLPYWTVMVYMAADNDLALSGIADIDEMEAAGADSEVQVVVQAEFSPTALALVGCTSTCFNRSNFDTFRYFVSSQGATVSGPNGPAIDIGNRNMTDPLQLRDFVTWARSTYPAQHYALVLWNHGGGYQGLLADETSATSHLMLLSDLPIALNGTGSVDVLDFDMCLMGGYETLVKLPGLASFVTFSEDVEPGQGNPYQAILDALQVNPSVDGRTVATIVVDQYDASYQSSRSSTTKSAYDMSKFSAFETSLDALAVLLRSNLSTTASAIAQAAASGQAYEYPFLKDFATLVDSLSTHVTNASVLAALTSAKAQATGAFRIRNRFHNSVTYGANDVSRSTGLSICMPSDQPSDQLPSSGPGSLAAYQALYSGSPWTLLLTDFLASQPATTFVDQGSSRPEIYLVWDDGILSLGGDVDLWILEPNGNVFIPYLGSVTPDGTLTNDSYYNATYYEGYLMNRFVESGEYRFYANLWIDPADYRPVYDIQYRYDQVSPLSSLYSPYYPRLSRQYSWLTDPTPTFDEADAGAYTDLQWAAYLTVSPPATPRLTAVHGQKLLDSSALHTESISTAQLATIKRALLGRRLNKRGAVALQQSEAPPVMPLR